MERAAAVFLVLLAFASGAASGFVLGRGPQAPAGLARGRAAVLAEIDRDVEPTPEQHRQIDAIMERNHSRFLAVRSKVEPELATIRSDVRAQIREVLDPERRARFEAYCAHRDELRKQQDQ
jgi:hypothetical protein